jgi:hypothetical protein
MKKLAIALTMSSSLILSGQSLARERPQLTPVQLQALQTREFETSKETLFAAVVSVFQDLGYQLDNADLGSGFITANSPNGGRTNFGNVLMGQRASGNTRATAFVEQMPNGRARVRLNFLNTRRTSSWYGQSHEHDRPVLDAATYTAAWDKIDEALFVRSAVTETVTSPTQPSEPSAPSTTPPTPQPQDP